MTNRSRAKLRISFSGLVLFVRQGGRITYALLREGKDAASGSDIPDRDEHCRHLVKDDFDHRPKVAWPDGPEELERMRLEFRWLINGRSQSFDTNGASPDDASIEDLPDAENRRSFHWVPDLADVGPDRPMWSQCYAEANVPDVVAAQVLIRGGTIYTGAFAWALTDDDDQVIPKLRWVSGDLGSTIPRRAAAEIVVWEVEIPSNASHLRLWCAPLDGGAAQDPCGGYPDLPLHGEDVFLDLSNSPGERCDYLHPGRRRGIRSHHFDMFYDLLDGPVSAFKRRIPSIPSPLGNTGNYRTFGTIPPLGAASRPLCIPASADG